MAQFKPYFDNFLLPWEGGSKYTETPGDLGGPTKYGITLKEWQQHGYDKNNDNLINATDVKMISYDDALKLCKEEYWDVFRADDIKNQSIAAAIVDFAYNCGRSMGKRIQTIVGAKADGVFGPLTISKINNYPNQEELFNKIQEARKNRYLAIVRANPSQNKFLKGWMNRTNNLKYND